MANKTALASAHCPQPSRGSANRYQGGDPQVSFVSHHELPHVYLPCSWFVLYRQAKAEDELLGFPWPRQVFRTCRALYRMEVGFLILKRRVAVSLSNLLHGRMRTSDEMQKLQMEQAVADAGFN